MPVHLFGKTVSTPAAAAIAAGSGVAIYLAYRQHKSSAAATTTAAAASAIDPVTGLPVSEDDTPDPLTGQAYLAEATEYGSVAAADQALSGSSPGSPGEGYDSYYAGAGTPADTSLVPADVVQGTTYGSNSAWAQAAEAGLTDIGYAPTDVSAALGRYLANLSETAAQATIVQAAIAEYGPPPVGSFQVIQAPAAGPVTTGTGGTFPLPAGHSVTPGTDYADLGWSAVPGAALYHYQVLSGAGASVSDQETSATSARVSGLAPKTAYRWRLAVSATAAKDSSPWSPEYPFTTT